MTNPRAIDLASSPWRRRSAYGLWILHHANGLLPLPLPLLVVLGFLWFTLVNHLRVEWSVNPQYAYGWSVPFLCAFLIWRRAGQASAATASVLTPGRLSEVQGSKFNASDSFPPLSITFGLLLAFCALAYAPTRLIEEANPEWRLISWALALEVIGITLLILKLKAGAGARKITLQNQRAGAPCATALAPSIAFPFLFFLVAVPWPSGLETFITQSLTHLDVSTTTELLSVFGIPSVHHGNIIEISSGLVGIDEACGGIRSLQATLMISLFFGEFYSLRPTHRAFFVLTGFGLAFLFNVGRTFFLVALATAKGISAVTFWHDAAGMTILVLCFLCLWLLAFLLKPNPPYHFKSPSFFWPKDEKVFCPRMVSLSLLGWILFVEAGTQLWYWSHERHLPATAAWRLELPRQNPSFRDISLTPKSRQMLRYDEGLNGAWEEADGTRWQAIFLRWKPGRTAMHLAKAHTPANCLTAAGRELVASSDLHFISINGFSLPFRSYVTTNKWGLLHVFYCLWEDRTDFQSFRPTHLTYANRLTAALAGRRNGGQRSMELAVDGIEDAIEVEAALERELTKIIIIDGLATKQRTSVSRWPSVSPSAAIRSWSLPAAALMTIRKRSFRNQKSGAACASSASLLPVSARKRNGIARRTSPASSFAASVARSFCLARTRSWR